MNFKETAMRLCDMIRYGLWCGVVTVAVGNRRQYAMTTTWLPHLVTNTISLLLPDAYRILAPPNRQPVGIEPSLAQPAPRGQNGWQLPLDTLTAMVRDNPSYVLYVAPLAAGYMLSSPWLNIYKGDLADVRLAGFGLDTFPHVATAFALTCLVRDTFHTAVGLAASEDTLAPALRWIDDHGAIVSAAVLALATLVWEYGEFKIHLHEMAERGDSLSINMQWSVSDMISDCISNAIGWSLAIASSGGLRLFIPYRYRSIRPLFLRP